MTPRGVLGTYRKTHLYYEETLHFAPGDTGFPVWTAQDRAGASYRLGVMICFDWFFSESTQTLAAGGADVVAHPSNLVLPHCPSAMPYRALEAGVFTATANRTGSESNGRESLWASSARARICSPRAEVLATGARRPAKPSISGRDRASTEARATAAQPVQRARRGDRRPDLYATE